ncbi:PAS domain S-box/diguanylate cyclase (GGDEF) domain [Gulbenkiania indica]|uniref:PAS domain S-box/diguanylate cyclase (GGDEF) domain n=1 Tax=Gulbenkiania indica TaxID=375574 RepID=A0A0K6H365_9NEIS|nr:EAL domain-containing protein [Gulbenkiania indica]CUA85266.1 PAS domain S-box/diguanylate cyclase (GGDEF) domain [Gulbenkiania indica]
MQGLRGDSGALTRRFRGALALFLLLMLAALLGVSAFNIVRDRRNEEAHAATGVLSLARALEAHASSVFQLNSLSLHAIQTSLEEADRRGGLSLETVDNALREAMRHNPSARWLAVDSPSGLRLVAQSETVESASPPVTAAVRQALVPVSGKSPVVLRSLRLPEEAEPYILLASPLQLKAGRGHVAALLPIGEFERLYARLGQPGGMVAGLIALDGTNLFRLPNPARYAGRDHRHVPPMRAFLASGQAGTVIGPNLDTGRDTLFGFVPSDRYPFLAVAGELTDAYVVPWRQRTLAQATLLAAAILSLFLVAHLLRRMLHSLSDNEAFYRALLDNVSDSLLVMRNGEIIGCNHEAVALFGAPSADVLHGKNVLDLSPPTQPGGQSSEARKSEIRSRLDAGERLVQFDWVHQRLDTGEPIECEVCLSVVEWRGERLWLAVVRDLSVQKRYLREQEFLANHDTLTGLPNRRWFTQTLEARLARRLPQTLLVLDLNRFKEINDTLGHPAGDQLLVKLGQRLSRLLLPQGVDVARLGGDELALLAGRRMSEEEVSALCQIVLGAISEPMEVENIKLEVSASVGVAFYPQDAQTSADLFRCADIAMYAAKHELRGYAFYRRASDHFTPERLSLQSDLAHAIRSGELALYYQPKISLTDGSLSGFEALLRWMHPKRGMVSPMQFIPLAENTELIHPLTRWVIREALQQVAHWQARGRSVPVAVNISVNNLHDPAFVEDLATMLTESRMPPGLLELEVTESALMNHPELALQRLNQIRALGVVLYIDDFGTGFSSLAYLKSLPVSALKIDRVFVAAMTEHAQDALIVQSTIELAHNFGLQVIAEGVEDYETAEALRRLGCDIAQGYCFARPMPAEEARAWQLSDEIQRLE